MVDGKGSRVESTHFGESADRDFEVVECLREN